MYDMYIDRDLNILRHRQPRVMTSRRPADDATGSLVQWSALLLFLLALVTWLLPFSPIFTMLSSPVTYIPQSQSGPPVYTAACFAPPQFTGAQVLYTNKICAAAINSLIQGDELNITKAGVWKLPQHNNKPLDRLDNEDVRFMPKQWKKNTTVIRQQNYSDPQLQQFIKVRVPLTLFVFALLLMLPGFLWSWLSSLVSVCIQETLVASRNALKLETSCRRELLAELANIVKTTTENSRLLALSYLFYKFLMIVVLVAEIYTLMQTTEVELNSLDRSLMLTSFNDKDNLGSKFEEKDYHDDGYNKQLELFCDMSLHQRGNIDKYTIQCVFSKDGNYEVDKLQVEDQKTRHESPRDLLWGYFTLIAALETHLIFLAVISAMSLAKWVSKLLICRCLGPQFVAVRPSLDMRFIMLMSTENEGPIFTQALGNSLLRDSEVEESKVH